MKKIKGQKSGIWALPLRTPQAASSPPALAVERRAFVRRFCDIGAVVDTWPAKIDNISQGGLKVVIGRRYEAGTILRIEFPLPGEEGCSMLLARVIHITPEPKATWSLGCALIQQLAKEELEKLLSTQGCVEQVSTPPAA